MKKIKNAFWAIGLLLALAGCGSNIVLDNPQNSEGMLFTIDGSDTHTLGPGETKNISLSAGSHKITIKGDKSGIVGDTTFTVKEGGILHSPESNYIVWRQLYGLQTDRKTLLNEDWAMIDSTRFLGDFKVYPSNFLYIEKNWTLDLDAAMPESQTLFVTKDYKVESKIFREADFIKTYREMAEKTQKPQ